MEKISNITFYSNENIAQNIKENPDLSEEFIKELLVAKNAPTEPFEFEDENKLITRR